MFIDFAMTLYAALGGVNLKKLLDDATDEIGGKLLDFNDRMGDRIQVFLEWFHIAFSTPRVIFSQLL